ncbi:MAG: H-type lectin domain-containing protein [Clostridiales bacterium]|nr:H-type lectin domain-containing protein [Clostridiales bacterium]
MQYKDGDGDISILYPVTTTDNVLRIDEYINKRLSELETEMRSGVSDLGLYSGVAHNPNGLLIQWGGTAIQPSESNVTKSQKITFPVPFDYAPAVFLNPRVTSPGSTVKGLSASNIGTESFDAYLLREGTTNTSIVWVAIGYAAIEKTQAGDSDTSDSGWVDLPLLHGFTAYDGDSANRPQYRKAGSTVTVRGILSPPASNTIASSRDMMQIAQLPDGIAPTQPVLAVCQGSAQAVWMLQISTDGGLYAGRYRLGDAWSTPSSTAWMPFYATFYSD